MSLGLLSFILLVILMASSMFLKTNPGIIGFFMTFLLVIVGGKDLGFGALASFPVSTVVMVMSLMIFYAYANANGTIDSLCKHIIKILKGRVALLPLFVFVLVWILSASGPAGFIVLTVGAITMNLAEKVGISPTLMAIITVNGASAGSMSPVAAGGAVAYTFIDKMGLSEHTADIINRLFINGLIANILVCILAYIMFGGIKLIRNKQSVNLGDLEIQPFTRIQIINLALIAIMIIAVVVFKQDLTTICIILTLASSLLRLADEETVFKKVNFSVIVMICGVSTLVGFVDKVGGISIFTDLLADSGTPLMSVGLMGFLPGLVSAYSTSTAVVLPAFLTVAGDLITRVNVHPMAVLSAICFSTYIVDASPLSTAGAACLGFVSEKTDRRKLYKQLLLWGFFSIVLSTVISVLVFGIIMY